MVNHVTEHDDATDDDCFSQCRIRILHADSIRRDWWKLSEPIVICSHVTSDPEIPTSDFEVDNSTLSQAHSLIETLGTI